MTKKNKSKTIYVCGCIKNFDYETACPFYVSEEFEYCNHPAGANEFSGKDKAGVPPPNWCPLKKVPELIIIFGEEKTNEKE